MPVTTQHFLLPLHMLFSKLTVTVIAKQEVHVQVQCYWYPALCFVLFALWYVLIQR